MNLKIDKELFLVLGVTNGFGKAVCEKLLDEQASVIGIARNEDGLKSMENKYPNFKGLALDLFTEGTIDTLLASVQKEKITGVLINAGGPPATSALDSTLIQWDVAYKNVLRWKIELTQKLLPKLEKNNYGRIIYIESASVKQPIENLVLSNSLRMAVVGFVKTLAQEMANSRVTFNILAPGYHKTSAVDRLIKKKAETNHISETEAKKLIEVSLPSGKMGNPSDFATLATWLFSPCSNYVNGQIFYVDGGSNKASL